MYLWMSLHPVAGMSVVLKLSRLKFSFLVIRIRSHVSIASASASYQADKLSGRGAHPRRAKTNLPPPPKKKYARPICLSPDAAARTPTPQLQSAGGTGSDACCSIGLGMGGAVAPENGPKNVPIFCPPKRLEKFEAQPLGFTLFDAFWWPDSGPEIRPAPVMDRARIQRVSRRLPAVMPSLRPCSCPFALAGRDVLFPSSCGRPARAGVPRVLATFIAARQYQHARFSVRG